MSHKLWVGGEKKIGFYFTTPFTGVHSVLFLFSDVFIFSIFFTVEKRVQIHTHTSRPRHTICSVCLCEIYVPKQKSKNESKKKFASLLGNELDTLSHSLSYIKLWLEIGKFTIHYRFFT